MKQGVIQRVSAVGDAMVHVGSQLAHIKACALAQVSNSIQLMMLDFTAV